MITNRKLLALWGVAVLAYALAILLASPTLVTGEARQQAVYEAVTAAMCAERAASPPEDNERTHKPLTVAEQRAADRIAAEYGLTYRAVFLIYERGQAEGWAAAPCPAG